MLALFNFIKSLILNVIWNCFAMVVVWFYYKICSHFIFNGWDRPIINLVLVLILTAALFEVLKEIFKNFLDGMFGINGR